MCCNTIALQVHVNTSRPTRYATRESLDFLLLRTALCNTIPPTIPLMLIEINRIYVGSGLTKKQLINLRYVKRIETLEEDHKYAHFANTLLIQDDGEESSFIYAQDTYAQIKTKLTLARKQYHSQH